jgi:outer membrane protein OmpA-like peptidoglycan-associated protein
MAQTSVTPKKPYLKVQGRLKAGMGQTFKALPTQFDDILIHNWKDSFNYANVENDFLNTKWGFYGGANFDYYFHPNIGVGIDADYFKNKLDFKVPDLITDYLNLNPEASLNETDRVNQSLFFIGIGPSFKVFTNSHWDIDVNLRVGLSHLNMGALTYKFENIHEDLNRVMDTLLFYDYSKPVNTLGLKAGLFVNYWFTPWMGVTVGADYIHSFVSASKIADNDDYVFRYKNPEYYLKDDKTGIQPYLYFDSPTSVYKPTKLNVNHVSVSAGLVFRFIPPEPKPIEIPVVVKEVEKVPDPKDILVLVKDSMTNIPIEGVVVNLKDNSGSVVESKKTGADGKVTFVKVKPADYTVSGTYRDMKTNVAGIARNDFFTTKDVIYKELLLNNLNFILQGVTEECTKKKVLPNTVVELTNKNTGIVTKVTSGADGNFTFNLEPNTDYSIVGTKDGYYSGIQDITTKGLNRSQTLFVKLTLCVEQLEVGKTFVLNNIYYDFDKCNIRADASVELDRLVQIMKENPTMEIELSSHTDQRGSDVYNQKLSQCRAESAVAYIISKGIAKSRIVAKGYGETKLLKDCTLDPDCPQTSKGDCPCHQNNRRTEVKITKM